jgi:hypothetical protein
MSTALAVAFAFALAVAVTLPPPPVSRILNCRRANLRDGIVSLGAW